MTSSWAPAKHALDRIRRGPLGKYQAPETKWLEPETSVGAFEAKVGEHNCWKVVGPAREAWLKISPDIKSYLEAHTEPIASSSVAWIIRMIGATPDTSLPTIIFLCEEKVHRKAAWKAIKKSNVLGDYHGMQLAHLARAPGSTSSLVAMSGTSPILDAIGSMFDMGPARPTSAEHDHVFSSTLDRRALGTSSATSHGRLSQDLIPAKPDYHVRVFSKAKELRTGYSLVIEKSSRAGYTQSTTIGGSIRIMNVLCLMTAARPFEDPQYLSFMDTDSEICDQLAFSDSDEDDGDEDDGDEDDDDQTLKGLEKRSGGLFVHEAVIVEAADIGQDGFVRGDSHISDSESSSRSSRAIQPSPNDSNNAKVDQLHVHPDPHDEASLEVEVQKRPEPEGIVGRLLFSSIVDSRPELDYALLVLNKDAVYSDEHAYTSSRHHSTLQFPAFTSEDALKRLEETSIFTKTASTGWLGGIIDSTATFIRSPNATHYQEVYSVRFYGALAQGDCGSWVQDRSSEALHGHIVAGSPKDGLAYIVPACQVFDDLSNFFTSDRRKQYFDPDEWSGLRPRVNYSRAYSSPQNESQLDNLGFRSRENVTTDTRRLLEDIDAQLARKGNSAVSSFDHTTGRPVPLTHHSLVEFNHRYPPITTMEIWRNKSVRPY